MPHFHDTGDGKAFSSLLALRSVQFTLVSVSSYPKASYDSDFKTKENKRFSVYFLLDMKTCPL